MKGRVALWRHEHGDDRSDQRGQEHGKWECECVGSAGEQAGD
jgi:hypothetical protein